VTNLGDISTVRVGKQQSIFLELSIYSGPASLYRFPLIEATFPFSELF
jgi:hypothetical protein